MLVTNVVDECVTHLKHLKICHQYFRSIITTMSPTIMLSSILLSPFISVINDFQKNFNGQISNSILLIMDSKLSIYSENSILS